MTKELFIEVMGKEKMYACLNIETQELETDEIINIHELAWKCKEWALDQGYVFDIYYEKQIVSITCYLTPISVPRTFRTKTEIETIEKMCEWILEQKDKA